MARWQETTARAAHALLYGLLFLVPLTGWMLSSVEGDAIIVFGLFELPGRRNDA
jgi:cytochrome b561